MHTVARWLAFVLLLPLHSLQAQTPGTSAGERTRVDLTVYNQNLSLIREERTMTFRKGLSTVVVPDIAATIDGTSLHFLSLTDPMSVRVLEQNYQYDLVSREKLLEKYVGKEIDFGDVKGTLLAAGSRSYVGDRTSVGMVAEINGKIRLDPPGQVSLPKLPEGLILKPQLMWMVECSKPGEHKTEISYLAGQISWSANYVALLDKDDAHLDLTGWVTLTNNSGTSFHDAGLKLVAGDVNVVRPQLQGLGMRAKVADEAMAAPQFTQGNLFEYKLYTLQRHTDLNNNETKQIELASGTNITAKKQFIYDGMADVWRNWYQSPSYRSQESFGEQSNTKVGTYVTFKNDKASGIGIPLPKGTIRVYKRDDDGKEQFVGEDQIDHTPKDEEVRLYLGNAFDIVGERAQADFKSSAAGRWVDETIRIKVRNHKTETVAVMVVEHPWRWSQWEITKKSDDFTKVDQSTLQFPITLAPDQEKVVTYTIHYSW